MFAMPQSGTGVSVEAVDPVFQVDIVTAIVKRFQFNLFQISRLWFSGKNVGHVETDWTARDGCWLVS